MCLAIPTLIKSIEGTTARAEIGGVERNISVALTPDVQVGDYVLVHTGFAIGVIDEEEAQETLRLLEELAEFYTDEMVAVETVQSAGSGPEHEVH
jgi:hydrogenase expression/formation protein HypC